MITKQALDAALEAASDESMLQAHYRDLVRPLLRMPRSQWPTCCGSICEPCSATLVRVAERTLQLLGVDALSDDEPT